MRTIKTLVKEITERIGRPSYYVVEVNYVEFVFETYEAATEFALDAFIHNALDVRITLTRDMNESTQLEEGE